MTRGRPRKERKEEFRISNALSIGETLDKMYQAIELFKDKVPNANR